jgi:hypothetical protein
MQRPVAATKGSGKGGEATAPPIFHIGEETDMKYLHWDFNAGHDNVIRIDLQAAANVVLLDDINYSAFRRGSAYRHFGPPNAG